MVQGFLHKQVAFCGRFGMFLSGSVGILIVNSKLEKTKVSLTSKQASDDTQVVRKRLGKRSIPYVHTYINKQIYLYTIDCSLNQLKVWLAVHLGSIYIYIPPFLEYKTF